MWASHNHILCESLRAQLQTLTHLKLIQLSSKKIGKRS